MRGDLAVVPAAELRLTANGGYNLTRAITVQSGSSGIKTISSTNTTGTNTLSGGITLNAGVTFDVVSGGILAVTTSGITGAGKVTKTGAGTFNVTAGTVSHTGGTEVTNGMIDWNNNGATNFGSGTITLSGGTMRWTTGNNNTLSTGNNVEVGAGGGTIEVRSIGNAGNRTFTGTISGSGPLVLRHTGGSNTATGRLSADNSGFTGTLTVASDDASNNGSAFYFNSDTSVPGGSTNTITMAGTRPVIGAGTNGMTLSNPIVVTGSLQYGLRSPGIRWDFTGSVDAGGRNLLVTGSDQRGLVRYAPSSVTNHTGSATVGSGALQSSMSSLPTGNLSISGGIFLLDGSGTVAPAWSGVAGNSLTQRVYGTGAGQWQFTGGGFAAKGTAVTIPTTTGVDFGNKDFRLGSAAVSSGTTLYADAAVTISADIALTGNRTITVAGGNQESLTLWTINSPVHEISGLISESGGARILNIAGVDRNSTQNGTIRLSNTGNSFSGGLRINSSSSGGSGGGGGVVVIATDDAVLGSGSIIVGTGGSGAAGMLVFENQGGGTKTFNRSFTIDMGTDSSSGDSGFGSWDGGVQYTGTVTITGSRTTLPVHVQAGTMSFGTGGTIINNSSGTQNYSKGGPGELVLDGTVTYSGSATNIQWALRQGTLTTTSASLLVNGSPAITLGNVLGGSSTVTRQWSVRGSDHTLDLSASGGGTAFGNNITIDVESGRTLTFNMGATQILNNAELLGSGAGPNGWSHRLVKTGAGTWVYNSTKASSTAGGNLAGHIRVDGGTFDVRGDMGRTSLYLNGGAILAGELASTPFIANRLRIDPTGGKIGISVNAAGDVSRGIVFDGTNNIWDLGGTGTLELASRDDYSLVWAQTAFPNLNAGETLRVTRDGSGTGVVRINDTSVDFGGTLDVQAALRMGAAGTGTARITAGGLLKGVGEVQGAVDVQANGTIAPGNSIGTLTVGSLTLASTAVYEVEVGAGTTSDRIVTTGDTGTVVSLGGATLTLVAAGVSGSGGTYLIIDQNASAGAVSGTFANSAGVFAGIWNYVVHYNVDSSLVAASGNDVYLSVSPVPEPASLGLLAMASVGLLRRRRA